VIVSHFTKSLRFKVTLVVIAVELLIFPGLGVYYTHRFSQEIDNAIIARLSIPGLLMTRGELRFDAVSDKRTMEGLLREPYSEGVVIGLDGRVYFSSNPARLETQIDEIDGLRLPGPESSPIAVDAPDLITPLRDDTGTYLTCLSPLRPDGKLTGYLYLKVGTEISEAEKRKVSVLFAIGSLATIVLTAAILSLLLHLMVNKRLNYLVGVFRRFAQGDYAARAQALGGDDEIATLMNGFNGLAKRLEDTLAHLSESESRFRVLVEHAPEAILVYDFDEKHFVDANQNAERLFACSRDQLRLASPTTLYAPVQTDKTPAEQGEDEYLHRTLAGEEVVVERAITNATGQQLLCEVRLVLLPAGTRRLIRASYIDITQRRQAEDALRLSSERLQLATRVANIGIWDWDIPKNKLVWDDSMYQLYGIQREDFGGAYDAWIRTIHPEDKAHTDGEIQAALRGEREYAPEFRIIRMDGTIRHIKADSRTTRDQEGRPLRMIGTNIDITELKQAEMSIRTLNQELEQRVAERTSELQAANRELETFTYSVSHDLRQPLRHIDGFLGKLKKRLGQTLDDESQRYMATISAAALRMAVLIDDLLSFSRSGRFEMTKAPVDLGALAQEVVAELEPATQDRVVEWRIGELPVVIGDRAMLRVVLGNLISNALKFTQPRERAAIEIGCQQGSAGETIVFVRDNGVGFDMKYADKLFRVFERLHGVDEFKGTGIGLANVRRVIARHRGRTWADGKVDGGATFYFSLPQAAVSDGSSIS
jgi:PAS domain S-box-containing protein